MLFVEVPVVVGVGLVLFENGNADLYSRQTYHSPTLRFPQSPRCMPHEIDIFRLCLTRKGTSAGSRELLVIVSATLGHLRRLTFGPIIRAGVVFRPDVDVLM